MDGALRSSAAEQLHLPRQVGKQSLQRDRLGQQGEHLHSGIYFLLVLFYNDLEIKSILIVDTF